MRRRSAAVPLAGLIACHLVCLSACHKELMRTPNLYVDAAQDPWASVPTALRTPDVEVIYATDRARLPEAERVAYGHKRSAELAFGTCTVSIGGGMTFDELRAQSTRALRTRPVPVKLERIEELGRYPATPWSAYRGGEWVWVPENQTAEGERTRELQDLIGRALDRTPHKEAVIYVHGFNNSFQDAALVSAELWHFCGRQGVPIVYTWPAGSGLTLRGYNYDSESGAFTVFHLKQFLEAVAGTPGLERLHLIAHSRGTEVLVSALRELHIRYTAQADGDIECTAQKLRLGNVILAAPDIDIDVALQRLAAERVDAACARMTVYTSPDDLALAIAKWLFGSIARIGTLTLYDPPRGEPTLAMLPSIDLIDVRVVSDWIGHAYFYANPAASSDVIMVLRYNRDPGAAHGRPLQKSDGRFWELGEGYRPRVE